jgi:hypothetical protein
MNIKFNINYFLILYSSVKIILLLTDENFSLFSYINVLHICLMIYYQSTIYDCICFVIEFFIGLISLISIDKMSINQRYISLISILPAICMWSLIGIIYTYYQIHGFYYNNSHSDKNINIENVVLTKLEHCSICLNNISLEGFTICNNKHYFHKNCIQKWIDIKDHNCKCPYCRQ